MHELSIAVSIVDVALEEAELRGARVEAIHVRIGPLSGVVKEALLSAYGLACESTPLAGSRLVWEDVPVVVFCDRCQAERPVHSIQPFCCSECETPSSNIVQGRELQVFALEVSE